MTSGLVHDGSPAQAAPAVEPVLTLDGVTISANPHGRAAYPLVTDVSLAVQPGESVALVGESGSGKSITALSCIGLLPEGVAISAGRVSVSGTSILDLSREELRRLRGQEISMIFQDPMTSLDPCFTVGDQIVESVLAHRRISTSRARELAVEMLDLVGIPEPRKRLRSYPHEFSGGMRQRVMIAGALVLRPRLLLADEPTTALDVTTQAAILELISDLRRELGMSVLWISHDLGVVAQIADRVAVMYAGELVEVSPTRSLFSSPVHPYTRGLIASSVQGRRGDPFGFIPGSVPEPEQWPPGCRFASRCPQHDEHACAPRQALRPAAVDHVHRCALSEPGVAR